MRDTIELKPFEIVEETGTSRVLLEASVYDKAGKFVSGLERSSFTVTEDGVPQEIDLVNQETLPATFALLIDSSQSMSRRIDFVRDAATRFIQYLRPKDQVLVAPFTRRLGALTGRPATGRPSSRPSDTSDRPAARRFSTASSKWRGSCPRRRAGARSSCITDGYDENSVTTPDEALAAVKAARVTVYVVGIGGIAGISLKGERLLKRIAARNRRSGVLSRHARKTSSPCTRASPRTRRTGTSSPTRRAIRWPTARGDR